MCEGISGFRYVNGIPGEAPIRPNLSIGDSIAGLHAAFGIVLSLLSRKTGGTGQVVDVALYEAMFNLLEGVIPEYDGAGVIREPSGTTVTGIAPTNIETVDILFKGVYDKTYIIRDNNPKADDFDKKP